MNKRADELVPGDIFYDWIGLEEEENIVEHWDKSKPLLVARYSDFDEDGFGWGGIQVTQNGERLWHRVWQPNQVFRTK